jgi:hypothetical protein
MKGKKEEAPIYSAGFYDSPANVVFEQVLGSQFAFSKGYFAKEPEGDPLDIEAEINGKKILPYTRIIPWPLVEKPLPYLNQVALYKQVRTFIQDYFFSLDDRVYDIMASWVMATYIQEKWFVAPYLFFFGLRGTGKTRAMEVLQSICYRGFLGMPSLAALFHGIQEWKIVFFLDETEILNNEGKTDIIGCLNMGYRRGQHFLRMNKTDEGMDLEPYDVFRMKCLAGTDTLKDTLESRCIPIKTSKNLVPVKFRIHEREAATLRAQLLQCRFDVLTGDGCDERDGCDGTSEALLKEAEDSRIKEIFEALLQVSNDGKENIISYAKDLEGERQEDMLTSVDAEVFAIIQELPQDKLYFNEEKTERIFLTSDVANELNLPRLEKDKLKNATVGKIIRRLLFAKRHQRTGGAWLYDEKKIEMWSKVFKNLPSQPSQPSQKEGLKNHE